MNFSNSKALYSAVIFSLILATNLSAQSQPSDSLTLDDVVRLVKQNHPAIEAARGNIEAAQARASQTESAEKPAFGADLNYVRIDPVPTFDINGHEMELAPHNNFNFEATGHYTIYDYGRNQAEQSVGANRVKAAGLSVETIQFNLTNQAIQLFYSILMLQRSLLLNDQQVAALEEHSSIAKLKTAAGAATDFDVLTTEVRVAAARNQRIDIENNRQRQEIALKRLIGWEDKSPLKLKGSFGDYSKAEDWLKQPSDTLEAKAYSGRPEIAAVRQEIAVARAQKSLIALSDKPSFDANGAVGFKNGYVPNLNELRANWMVGLRASMPIYRGRITERRLEESQAMLRSAQARLIDLQQQVASEVRLALADLGAARDKMKLCDLLIEQAQSALDLANKRYEAGAGSNLDVLDAETSLAQANFQQVQAQYAVEISLRALFRALGRQY
jgi:outer membrane protein